jgi:hypothetical protein
MIYLLDTDTCVFALRGLESVSEQLHSAEADAAAISVITLASCVTEQSVPPTQTPIIKPWMILPPG